MIADFKSFYSMLRVLPRPTARGYLLLLLSLYLLLIPAKSGNDIIASGFSITGMTGLLFFLWLCLIARIGLEKNLRASVSSDQHATFFSRRTVNVILKLSGVKLPGLITASCNLAFKHAGVVTSVYEFTSLSENNLIITEQLNFPHRGIWEVSSLRFEISDLLGLVRIAPLLSEINWSFTVDPAPGELPAWPMISSSFREEDTFPHHLERKGDLYDFRQYQPSDGVKRIIWKLFAKSGELYSRQPESAYSPQGKVAIFCLAKSSDDDLVFQTIEYIKKLEEHEVEVLFSTMSVDNNLATNSGDSLVIAREHCFSAEMASDQSVIKCLDNLISVFAGNKVSGPHLENLCVALSQSSLSTEDYRRKVQIIKNHLADRNITALFLLSSGSEPAATSRQSDRAFNKRLLSLFIELPQSREQQADNSQAKLFLSSLPSDNSQVIWS